MFWLALLNSLRLVQAIHFWDTLTGYQMRGGPFYLAVSGGIWAAIGFLLCWATWQGKSWAWAGTLGGASGYGSWYWFDRLALQTPHVNWPFALVTTAVFLIIVLFILYSPRSRQFYSKR